MENLATSLNIRYESVLKSVSDTDFYMAIYHYFDFIHKSPQLLQIFEASDKEYSEKFHDIWKEKRKYTEEELDVKCGFVSKLERFNLYAVGCTMYMRIYLPLDDYVNSNETDRDQDSVPVLLTRGLKYAMSLKRWSERYLLTLNKWFDGKRNMYEAGLRRFHVMFLNELEKPKPKLAKPEIAFDSDNSVLHIGDRLVQIKMKNDKPNSHYVLEYIFGNPDGIRAQAYYSEILESKFKDERKDWRSMFRACGDINTKVSKQAQVSNFLLIKTGKTGYAQINPEYI